MQHTVALFGQNAEFSGINKAVHILNTKAVHILNTNSKRFRDKWVPVTTAWSVLSLRMEERPPIWKVAANILNIQSRTADTGWFSSLGVGRGANNFSRRTRLHGEST
jgi:hypothetical protein